MQTVYRGVSPDDRTPVSLEASVPSWRGQVNIDRVTNTATVVRAHSNTEHPTMSVSAIKRIFSVSSLTSGQ